MLLLTANYDVFGIEKFDGLKLIRRGDITMVGGMRYDVAGPHVLLFLPRGERGYEDGKTLIKDIALEIARGSKYMDLSERTVVPDTQMLVDAGLLETELAETQDVTGADNLEIQAVPKLPPCQKIIRLKLGHDDQPTVFKLNGRRILSVEVGGDGTVALFVEGPYDR